MVALFLRPDADIIDGGWTDEGGATTLFDAVDETSFSDTDYIKSSAAEADIVSLRLSDPSGTVTEPMLIRYRCKYEGAGAVALSGRLYEATSPPTLITSFENTSITTSFATYTHTLTTTEFNTVTDFNNLYVEFERSAPSPLLDTLSVSPSVAYSTRKLRAAYAGNALRVRRSSDNNESDIGFDSSGNLDTSALATFVGAGNGQVVTWYDQSGNANNAANATAIEQPTIVSSGSLITLNSKASIRYGPTQAIRLAFSLSLSQPDTIALVFVQTSALTGRHITDGTGGTRQLLTADNDGGAGYRMYAGAVISGGTVDTNSHGMVGVFNGANSVLYIDNTSTATGNPGSDGMTSQYIGASQGGVDSSLRGDVPEYVVFASALGATDRATLRTSWTNYWGTP